MNGHAPFFTPNDPLLAPLVTWLQRHPMRIVFPDGNDLRVLQVAAELVSLQAVVPILLGNRASIRQTARTHGIKEDFIGMIEPAMSTDFISFCERYRKMERARLRRIEAPNEIMSRPSWYAAMMVQYGYADGIVGGNITLPAAYFRALLHLIKRMPGLDSASSCVPVTLTDRRDLGSDGTIFLADCAVVPSPTVSQLANAAVETARCAGQLLRIRPRVAMISFSTRGSARSESTQRVVAATELARERARRQFVEMDIDGELEVDAAIQPEVAMSKAPQSILGGRANVLVFPDLNSAHSAFKLIEIVGRARSAGQQVLGLVRPAAQVSRVCSGQTIFSAAITTAVRAGAFRDWINSEPES